MADQFPYLPESEALTRRDYYRERLASRHPHQGDNPRECEMCGRHENEHPDDG